MVKLCSSCGTEVRQKFVEFKCPQCGETEMIRCKSCRGLGTPYVCEKCGFKGP